MCHKLQRHFLQPVFRATISGASQVAVGSHHVELQQNLLHFLCRKNAPRASLPFSPAAIRLWHCCSRQISKSNHLCLLPALKQLDLEASGLASKVTGVHWARAVSGLSRKPKLVDEICQQLRANGWNSSTADSLERLDGINNPRIVAMILSERIPTEAAMGFFEWMMNQDGFKPTLAVYNAVIGVLGKSGRIDKMQSVVEDMSANGCDMDVVTYTQLIHAYKMSDDIDSVFNVYKQMKETDCQPNVVLYTAMIGALAKGKRYQEMTEIYNEMVQAQVSPNVITFNVLMRTLYEAGNLDAAFEILKKMQRIKIYPGASTYTLFIKAYAKAGDIEMVKNLITEMKGYGFTSGPIYSDIVYSLVKEGNEKDAQIIAQELWPDEESRAKFLNFEPFSKSGPGIKHQALENQQGKPTCNISEIIKGLQSWTPAKVAALESANVDWKSHQVVLVVKRVKDVHIALEFYYWLKNAGFKHDTHTSSAIVLRLAKSNKFSPTIKLLLELKKAGDILPLPVYNEVIKFACMAKKFKAARMVVNIVKESGLTPNLMTYSNLIMGLASNRLCMAALRLFRLMLHDGIRPDNTTVTTLLYRIGSSDDLETAASLFKELLQYGLKFDANVYMALLYAYCKHGKFEMAVKIYNEMKTAGLEPVSIDGDIAVILSSFDNPEEVEKLKEEDIKAIKSYILAALGQETSIGTYTKLQQHLIEIHDVLAKNLIEGNLVMEG